MTERLGCAWRMAGRGRAGHDARVRVTMRGAIELPREVLIAEDCVGRTITGLKAGEADFEMSFPTLPPDMSGSGGERLTPPLGMDDLSEALGESGWGYMGFGGAANRPRPLASWIGAVGISASWSCTGGDEAEEANQAAHFGAHFDSWFGLFGQWLELWSSQHVVTAEERPSRTRGQVRLSLDSRPAIRTGWSPPFRRVVTFHNSQAAIRYATASSAAANASERVALPLEWELLQRATWTDDRRRSLIDAATAAETGLAAAVRRELGGVGPDALETIIQSANGIVGLVTLLESLKPVQKSRRSRVADRLAGPRNRAAHQGATPERTELEAAFNESEALLDLYSPRPSTHGRLGD